MTPCQKLGHKVGDKFILLNNDSGFKKGQVVTLYYDDGTTIPFFSGDNKLTKGYDDVEGAYLRIEHDVEKVKTPQLEQLIIKRNKKLHKVAKLQKQIHKLYSQIQSLKLDEVPEDVCINDPTTWKTGDVIECTDGSKSNWVTEGKRYVLHSLSHGRPVLLSNDKEVNKSV